MGEQSPGSCVKGCARAGAVTALALLLTNCAGGNLPVDGRSKNTSYSPKMVADGEPVPRGGGTFKLGNPYTVNGRTYYPSHDPAYQAEGIASWYGADFHGRKTANGEIYDMNAISAAHPTLPLPSYARVTNLENGRSIIVRVNDRGPYTRNRIIDLSTATAKALGTYGKGLARVRVEYVGRAGLAGSNDAALLASLRNGSPAPVPSMLRVASGPSVLGGRGDPTLTPLPPARPFSLGDSTSSAPVRAKQPSPPKRAQSPAPMPAQFAVTEPPSSPAAARTPALSLMSGRGLY
ncbi:MAG: septal ring lytic transglycosylase RlpA family protein [Hyphomicrobiales bacterium]|nr:septal ring lytic transglycosylase RlpA family protein [Hyphomicrobiales bacterium]